MVAIFWTCRPAL